LSERSIEEELNEAQAELKQLTTPISESESSKVNDSDHLLHEKILVLERERSEMKSIVEEVVLQLEGLSVTKEEEGKQDNSPLELESDNAFAIYERLRKSVVFINPLKNYVLQAHFKENEITRLKEQVEALESEVMEVKQLAQAHDTLNRQAPAIGAAIGDIDILGIKRSGSIDSFLDGSMMDDYSTFSNVRERMRKKRESASRFLHRFKGSPERKKNSNIPATDGASLILGLSVINSESESDADDEDSCSGFTLSGSPGMPLGYADEAKTDDDQDKDDEGMSYVIPNFAQISTSPARPPAPAIRTILKRDPLEQIPLDTRHKSWKKLPVPDLKRIGSITRSVTSDAESSCAYDDDDISLGSHQTISTSLASAGAPPRNPTLVRFESVHIRLYHQTLGDNPAVTYGPPITLDWKYDEMSPVKVDDYEGTRRDRISDSSSLFLSSIDRRRLLQNNGFTEDEINQASLEAEKARKERAMTNALPPAMKVQEVLQSTRQALHQK
jgi:hypothetical protein